MSFSERDINTIHSNTTFVNGRKYFGQFDNKVTSNPTTERILGNQDLKTEATIFIPVMERAEKFDLFLDSLKRSIAVSQSGLSLVILDNSVERKFQKRITNADFGSSVTEIYYHHDPRMTQSGGRNTAINNFSDGSKIIGIWDSDIYASEKTIGNLLLELTNDPALSGIAPPLGKFGGGSQEVALSIYKSIRQSRNARLKLHMPGEIGENNGVWKNDVLRTTMMRGSFFVKKDLVEKIAKCNPEGNPWLTDFVLWQNVPFFISARENNFDFGYLMRGDSVVLHDDRIDKLSVGFSLEYRTQETLKSIFMLMCRNDVFTNEDKEINKRFLEYNISAIERVTRFSHNDAVRFQRFMLEAVCLFNSSNSINDFKVETPKGFEQASEFIELLKYEPVFSRIKQIKSSNPSRAMYTV